MQLETIFQQIRKEQAILWIGSGFSMYAGYPGGQRLTDILYNSLSPEEKEDINPHLGLSDLAEQVVRLKDNRRFMNAVLQKEFLKLPSSKKWHEILAKIPHIKTIITTNYDRLFELAYKDIIHLILSPEDLVNRKDKVELFKVHGDIRNPDTIIITRSDYTDFFHNRIKENLIWSTIKERLSNNSVVFIGYDLEDENIKDILRQVAEELGSKRKQMFLIAPGFKQHKIKYLKQLSIEYFDIKGEVFIDKLYENIKDRITNDFDKGDLSPITLNKFYSKNYLRSTLRSEGDRFQLMSIENIANTPAKLKTKFKDIQTAISFKKFLQGNSFNSFTIEGQFLDQLKLLVNDINIVTDNLDDYKLTFSPKPKKEGVADLRFDNSTEFQNINYAIYSSQKHIELVGFFKGSEFSYKVEINGNPKKIIFTEGTLQIKLSETFENTNDAIAVLTICQNISESIGFTVFADGDSKGFHLKPEEISIVNEMITSNLDFFQSLKKIENIYDIRFRNIGNYSKEEFHNVYKLLELTNGNFHIQDWDEELTWDLDKGVPLDSLLKIEGGQFQAINQDHEEVSICGQKINIGHLVAEPQDLYITNLEEVKSGNTKKVKVKSKSKKIKLYYTFEINKPN